jgi:transmembrane sensor
MNLSWQPLSDQVADWLVLFRSGRATPADHASFIAWCAADPRNENAWQQLNSTLHDDSEAGRLSDAYPYASPEPKLEARPETKPAPTHTSSFINRRRLLGGLLTLGGTAVAGTAVVNTYFPLAGLANDVATQTGQRRLYTLDDGTQMLLDARTRINLAGTEHSYTVQLLEGAVSLTLPPDSTRSVHVRTAEGMVRLLGPHAMVRQQARRTLAVATSNPLEIETMAGARATIPPGSGARFGVTRIGEPRADLLLANAWKNGWIEARDLPLMEVIASLRPYRKGLLRITTAAGGLLAHGTYPLDDTDAALRALEASLPIQVRRITPWFTSIDVVSA